MTRLRVTDVRFTRASPRSSASGLVGFASCTVGGLRLTSIAVRRTLRGSYAISLLRRRGYPVVCGLSPAATRSLEVQILAALGLENAT